ncbi:hypothetical protein HaLaN_16035 [Haematococcus lacustris]|uniref:Uncharacterized protein n=1 Tax=Haematococcus lacustris TaxID=44745 RepID=A0A699ZJY6_HAELA|nr:hypothetical protein HaLaN_16035 [Haematococcus lacustris]
MGPGSPLKCSRQSSTASALACCTLASLVGQEFEGCTYKKHGKVLINRVNSWYARRCCCRASN